ncbi:MAG: nuclease-related domain-containing protein, partial [Candidatus Hydrogenedentota bacterium]
MDRDTCLPEGSRLSRPTTIQASARIRELRRTVELAADSRVGAYARRELRNHQTQWLRSNWQFIATSVPTAAVLSAITLVFIPQPLAPYVVGAIVASVAWWIYVTMLETGGMTALRSGVLGEQRTASELRKLAGDGWKTINHVMLEGRDVDHALLGPGGFFAVESKFRSRWSDATPYLAKFAYTAKESARQLQLRIDPKRKTTQPLVVMWGPDVSSQFDNAVTLHGVVFCPGRILRDFIGESSMVMERAEIDAAFTKLESYVKSQDLGEVKRSGSLPRPLSHAITDFIAICTAAVVL